MGGTLIFSYIRRLGPFFGVQNFEFQYFWVFSYNIYSVGGGGMKSSVSIYFGVITKLD